MRYYPLPNNDDNKNHSKHDCHNGSDKIVDFFFQQREISVRCACELRKLMVEMISMYFRTLQGLCQKLTRPKTERSPVATTIPTALPETQ
jgi:hypothetical protein